MTGGPGDDPDPVQVSKFLAWLLRHEPGAADLELDGEGFAPIPDVLDACRDRFGPDVDRALLEQLVSGDPPRRYQIRDDAIRALYGHSAIRPDYPEAEPPAVLYHGTVADALPSIEAKGLKPMNRHYVHLSTTLDRARQVGARLGSPVILRVRAAEAHEADIAFHHPEAHHWLAREVPPEFVEVPS